jgi:hypothetical protein
VTAQILIPSSLRNEDLFFDQVWTYDNALMEHDLYPIGPGTESVSTADPNANMLAATLYTADGQIVDSVLFRELCPDYTVAPIQTGILEVPSDYATIQAAVDAASDSDMVYVHPGTYYEHILLRPGVHLIGAGAHRTVIDGEGLGENLIDFTGAAGAVVRGFTLRNVGPRPGGCTSEDALDCSGEWFASAVYGDGHDPATQLGGCGSSVVLMHNVIEASDIGVLLYFYAPAAIRNNLFLDNGSDMVASYLNDRVLLVGNTFDQAEHRSLAASNSSAAEAGNNIFTGTAVATEALSSDPPGQATCNVLFDVDDVGWLLPVNANGNVYLDPGYRNQLDRDYRLRDDSAALTLGCYDLGLETSFALSPGAYGGPLGDWYLRDIAVEELKRFIE